METAQLPLSFVPQAPAPPLPPEPEDTDSLRAAYRQWRDTAAGQAVYAACYRQALTRRQQHRRFGIGALVEVVRWEMPGIERADDGFKINNNHRAYLARELCAAIPGLAELIETRIVRS